MHQPTTQTPPPPPPVPSMRTHIRNAPAVADINTGQSARARLEAEAIRAGLENERDELERELQALEALLANLGRQVAKWDGFIQNHLSGLPPIPPSQASRPVPPSTASKHVARPPDGPPAQAWSPDHDPEPLPEDDPQDPANWR